MNNVEVIEQGVKGIEVTQTPEELERTIELYKTQNPAKYEAKREALEAKLEYLKAGGDPALFDFPRYEQAREAAERVRAEEARLAAQAQKAPKKVK